MADSKITPEAIERRRFWIEEIRNVSKNFSSDCERLEAEIVADLDKRGDAALRDHLRLCGTIPESYGHDSSEEKFYSKYTDIIVACAFR